ncbi:MAG: stage II sporulation protein M [Peptococcaceae bacterium]|nr:stage II sporulation protein M [Peptococcaceae bacterium]
MRQKFIRYVRANWLIYLTLGCAFFIGVALGALGVHSLNEGRGAELDKFLGTLLQEQPKTMDFAFLQQLIREDLIMMLFIWVFGVTVVGIPLIYLIIAIRGAVVGFSVCFVVVSQGLKGLGFVLISIVLPSLLFFGCLLLGAGLATRFSAQLLRSRTSGRPLGGYFSQYTLMFSLTTVGLVVSSLVQVLCTTLSVSWFGF